MKNAISKATGCFIWLLSSQRTHLGIEVDKNVNSAGAFHFSIWHISLVPKPWGKCPPRSRRKAKQMLPGTNVSCPLLQAACLERKRTWQALRPFHGCAPGFSTTVAGSHLASGSSTASLRFFCAISSHSSWEAGHFKRSKITLILCFQKAHRQNVDPYGCMDPAYQLHWLPNTAENGG